MTRSFTEVVPGVLVATSRRFATITTVVTTADRGLVVDPAWDADELGGVAPALHDAGVECAAGLATHLHYDHVLWHPTLPPVPRWATPWSVAEWRDRRDDLLAPLVGDLSDDLLALAGRLDEVPGAPRAPAAVPTTPYRRDTHLPDPYPLPWKGRDIVLHEHDAHARGHLAIELPDDGVLLAGDMLSDVELPMPDDDDPDLEPYLLGLDRLAPVVARCTWLIPGHGTPTEEPLARLDADRRYLDAVLSGRPADDERMALPGMPELHRRTVAQAAATRPR